MPTLSAKCAFSRTRPWAPFSSSQPSQSLQASVKKVGLQKAAAIHGVNRRSGRPVRNQEEQLRESSHLDTSSEDGPANVSVEKPASQAPRLPWAVEPKAVNRRFGPGVSGLEEGGSKLRAKQERRSTERVQLSRKGAPPRLSARQQLLALDHERGEQLPLSAPPFAKRVRRNIPRVGAKQEWDHEARLAKRAVEAILASQGLDGRTGAMTAGMDGRPGTSTAVTLDAPIEEGGLRLGVKVGELGTKAESDDRRCEVKEAPGGRVLKANSTSTSDWGKVLWGSAIDKAIDKEAPLSATADECGAIEKKAALARALKPLAGSLSLFRWQEVLKVLGERGHWAVALDVFQWAQANLRIKPNAFTYAQMAMTLQAAGQAAPIIDLYHDALRTGIFPLPEQLFNAVIFAHVQQGNLPKGLEVLAAMEAAGCKPGRWTYTYLLQGCVQSEPGLEYNPDDNLGCDGEQVLEPEGLGGTDMGLRLDRSEGLGFRPETDLGRNGFRSTENGKGDWLGPGIMAESAFRLGSSRTNTSSAETDSQTVVEVADDLVRRMLASGIHHNVVTLNALVKVYAAEGQVARAHRLFGSFLTHGVKPDAGSYLNLFHASLNGGASPAHLLEVYRGMVDSEIHIPATVYYPLLRACAREKNLPVASELFSEMRALGVTPDERLYTTLVFVCGTVGGFPRAEGVLTEMVTQGLEVTAVTWNALLSGMRRGGAGFAEMTPVVKRMRAEGTPPDCATYSILLQACKGEGRVNTARRIYTAFRSDDSIAGNKVQVYQEALEIFSWAVMVDECETVTEHMLSEGLGFTQRAHEALVAAYAAELNYPAMAEALGAMLDEELTPGVVANEHLARALARGGRTEELLLLLKTIQEGGGRIPGRMWHYVIKAYVNRPKEDAAADVGDRGYSEMSETLSHLHRTSGPLPTAALVSLLGVISQADTWHTIEPLIALLGRINSPLFRSAFEVLHSEPGALGNGTSEGEHREADSKLVDAMVPGTLKTGRLTFAPGQEWAVDITERFVRLAQETEAGDSHLRRGLLGRMADALWFRGLRGRARALVRAILTLELHRLPDGRPATSGGAAGSGHVAESSGRSKTSHLSESWSVDLHKLSDGGACTLLLSWLGSHQRDVKRRSVDPSGSPGDLPGPTGDPPGRVEIITGWGKHRLVGDRQAGVSTVQAIVGGVLEKMSSPFCADALNEGMLTASGESVRKWLDSCPQISLVDERV